MYSLMSFLGLWYQGNIDSLIMNYDLDELLDIILGFMVKVFVSNNYDEY